MGGRVWLAPTSTKTCDQEHRIICTLLPHIKILVRYWPKNINFFTTNNSNYKKLVQTINSANIIIYFRRNSVWNLIFYSYNKATKFGHKQVRTVQVGNQEWDSGVVMIPTDFFSRYSCNGWIITLHAVPNEFRTFKLHCDHSLIICSLCTSVHDACPPGCFNLQKKAGRAQHTVYKLLGMDVSI